MTRKEKMMTAVLGASALALAATLCVRMPASTAHADQVINAGGYTFVTAEMQQGEEVLYVLDSGSRSVLVYKAMAKGRQSEMQLVGRMPLEQVFGQ